MKHVLYEAISTAARESGERCKLLQRKTNLMHFSLKIWHLAASIFRFPWLLQKNIFPWLSLTTQTPWLFPVFPDLSRNPDKSSGQLRLICKRKWKWQLIVSQLIYSRLMISTVRRMTPISLHLMGSRDRTSTSAASSSRLRLDKRRLYLSSKFPSSTELCFRRPSFLSPTHTFTALVLSFKAIYASPTGSYQRSQTSTENRCRPKTWQLLQVSTYCLNIPGMGS